MGKCGGQPLPTARDLAANKNQTQQRPLWRQWPSLGFGRAKRPAPPAAEFPIPAADRLRKCSRFIVMHNVGQALKRYENHFKAFG